MKRNFVVGLFGGLIGSAMMLMLLSAIGVVGARAIQSQPDAARTQEVSAATPLTSTFTYQGQLKNNGSPVTNPACQMAFRLYDDPSSSINLIGSPFTTTVPVTNGLFTVGLNFGSAFDGNGRWLDIQVNCGSGFVTLTPRQAVTAAPYSLFALSTGAHTHAGENITSGTVADARIDPVIARDAEVAASYYNKTEADNRFVNVTGPEFMSANSSVAALAVSQSGTGMASFFTSTATYGVKGETGSTALGQAGVLGAAGSATTLNRVSGVLGNSTNGFGVAGVSTNQYGVIGFSSNSIGVRGESAAGNNAGVWGGSWGTGPGVYGRGINGHGVQGEGDTTTGNYGGYFTGYGGVYGFSANWVGVYGDSGGNWGVYGQSPSGYGVMGSSNDGVGVYGTSYTTTKYAGYFYNGGGSGTNRGVGIGAFTGNGSSSDTHPGGQYYKAAGEFSGPVGIIAATSPESSGGDAIHALTGSASGLWALRATKSGGGDYAGYFTGNVYVLGNLSASGTKPFKIDNPLDPANQYLYHYAVESPEVQNMYNGTLVLDGNGAAVVTLPDYFSAINTGDYRYSLTPIGAPMPNLYIAEEIKGNTFKIAGGVAGQKVSWIVYGQRHDAWLRDHPATDVVDKPPEERGTYVYPQAYGLPESRSLTSAHDRVLNYTPLPLVSPVTATLPTTSLPPAATVLPATVPQPSTVP